MAPRQVPPQPEPDELVEPPFYEAVAPLPVGAPGAFPVYAYQPGDRVSPHKVGHNGWGDRVVVPDQFKGKLAPPPQPAAED
jgi:hypothetical protein